MATQRGGLSRPAAGAVCLLAALGIFALNAGSAYDQLAPERSDHVALLDSEAQRLAALRALRDKRTADAQFHAARSLILMPYNQTALALLALSLGGLRTTAALNVAAGLGWRDPLANTQLVKAAFAEGQLDVAAERIDAIGRTGGEEAARPLADLLISRPGGADALAVRAAHHAGYGWIPPYLEAPPANPAIAAHRARFVGLIDRDEGEWRRRVIDRAMVGFSAAGLDLEAYALWRNNLADPRRFSGPVYDGQFAQLGDPFPLAGEWAVNDSAGMVAEKREGGGLTLSYLGGATGFILGQTVLVAERPLHLIVRWEGPREIIDSLEWQLTCARGGKLAARRQLSPDGRGLREDIFFEPRAGCKLASLGLLMKRQPSSEGQAMLRGVAAGA